MDEREVLTSGDGFSKTPSADVARKRLQEFCDAWDALVEQFKDLQVVAAAVATYQDADGEDCVAASTMLHGYKGILYAAWVRLARKHFEDQIIEDRKDIEMTSVRPKGVN